MLEKMSNLGQRTTVSLLVTLLVWTVIYFSHSIPLLFVSMIGCVIALALWEFYHIAEKLNHKPLVKIAIIGAFVYVFAAYAATIYPNMFLSPVMILLAIFTAIAGYFIAKGSNPLTNTAITFLGIVYLVIPLSFMIGINYLHGSAGIQDGRCWLIYLLTVSKVTDMGGYFIGKNLGKTPLCPEISPKKTVAGAVGGLVTAVAFSLFFYFLSTYGQNVWPMSISLIESIVLGFAIGVLAQFGDLIESLFKREGGIKDSSNLPGLGGVLDIVDSLIFTTPLVYFFLKIYDPL